MKKLFAAFGILSFLATSALFAQGPGPESEDKRKQAEELRKKYYTRTLQLSEAESTVFWPIFNKHEEKIKAIRKQHKKPRLELMSDKEVEAFIDKHLDHEVKMLEAKRELYNNLKGKISARKIAMLPETEKKFRRDLLNRYKRNRGAERARGSREGGPRKGGPRKG